VSWLYMGIIALAQMQMSINVSALPVSIGGIVEDLQTSPASIGTALVVYSLPVAGFVMLGAKLGKRIGSRLAFQIGALVHGLAMLGMALSRSVPMMIQMQALAGFGAALLVPTLVVLIAAHYRGAQQAQSLGLLGASQALAGVIAFLVIGVLGNLVSWRWGFALIVVVSICVVVLSFRFRPIPPVPHIKIDWSGAGLAAVAIALISVGSNNLAAWGALTATPNAPASVLGMSPAPILIACGVFLGQAFFAWSRKRVAQQRTPLLALEVLDSPEERSATLSLFIAAALGPAISFLIPLYIQIVQGLSSLETAVAVVPYSLAIFVGTAMVVRLFDRLTPRRIGYYGFAVVTIGLVLLAFAILNDWGAPLVILALLVIGVAEGSLLTLVFNVLVSAAPKELAGDVGALRGTANNLATGLGTALASVLAVTLLRILVGQGLAASPVITDRIVEERLYLESTDFVRDDELDEFLAEADLTPEQAAEVLAINRDARVRALKISFLALAALSLLAVIPASGLPDAHPD
jgi:MFS family permease